MPSHSPSLASAESSLLNPDIEYLVGVSGGRDSMVLLHWLTQQLGCEKLVVCHFNHALRGEDSDGDAVLVDKVSKRLGVACMAVKNDSQVFAEASKQSLETAARESRYRFFAKVAKERGCQRLILAHHADDQVETVLMNLFRGAGLKGLGGMLPVSHRQIEGMPLEIIRPLLNVTRAEVDRYQTEHQVGFREDVTNSALIATRNRVRHELIPLAKDIFNRDISPNILNVSAIAEMEHAASQLRARRWLVTYQKPAGGLLLKPLRQLPPAELSQVIHLWLLQQEVGNCGHREVNKIIEMVRRDDKPAKVNLPKGIHCRRRAGVVFIDRGEL